MSNEYAKPDRIRMAYICRRVPRVIYNRDITYACK